MEDIKEIMDILYKQYEDSIRFWRRKYPVDIKNEEEYPYSIWCEKTLRNHFYDFCVSSKLISYENICLEFSFAKSGFAKSINSKWNSQIDKVYSKIGSKKFDFTIVNYEKDADYLFDFVIEFKFFHSAQSYFDQNKDGDNIKRTPEEQIKRDWFKLSTLVENNLVNENSVCIIVFDLYHDCRRKKGVKFSYDYRSWDILKEEKYKNNSFYFPAYIIP